MVGFHFTSPALAIYAPQRSAKQTFSFYELLDSVSKKRADSLIVDFKNFSNEEQARFKRDVTKGKVVSLVNARHAIFISNSSETEKLIREFLK